MEFWSGPVVSEMETELSDLMKLGLNLHLHTRKVSISIKDMVSLIFRKKFEEVVSWRAEVSCNPGQLGHITSGFFLLNEKIVSLKET
ncbi:hypothetical protein CEXT_20261 [Caerostris extrusa]|uniref:Uncharacterized protein n=1 Tax=Caerostris extrusa TaxID=172846 RepID=A0AAV4TDY8_CAEEX|nr:hypothetical protein CEXT_20261 [Caerostris extrusa]